jgi:putative ABC transport system permease protein
MIPIQYNVRNLAARRTTTLVTAFGIALVVFVLACSLMLGEGIKRTMSGSGEPDVAVVVRKGSDAELTSSIEPDSMSWIVAQPQVSRNASGVPLAVGEVVVVAALDKLGTDGGVSNVQIRGVPEDVRAFRRNAALVAGRWPRPGTDEVVIGTRIAGKFKGLDVGQKFDLKRNRPASVVGVFEDRGSMFESEVWADIDSVRTSFGREGMVSSVRVRLTDPAKFDAFKSVLEQDKQRGVTAERERKFYEKQSEGTSVFVIALGSVIAFFFSIGAMIGAAITMYSAVSNRQREFGTLRALGFSRRSILLSLLLESVGLALVGGLLGVLASLGMGLVKFSMMNFQSWSEIVFTFTPTPSILGTALLFAVAMGVVGGLFPAIRAARVSPVEAMRA